MNLAGRNAPLQAGNRIPARADPQDRVSNTGRRSCFRERDGAWFH